MLSRSAAAAGSALWFAIAPGTIAGLLPYLISDGRSEFAVGPILLFGGLALIAAGLAGLVQSFVRFAAEGQATPAPITPASKLIVGGPYRHVRNPMYVSVLAVIAGEALLFGQIELLIYTAFVWLALPPVRGPLRGAGDAAPLPGRLCRIFRGRAALDTPAEGVEGWRILNAWPSKGHAHRPCRRPCGICPEG